MQTKVKQRKKQESGAEKSVSESASDSKPVKPSDKQKSNAKGGRKKQKEDDLKDSSVKIDYKRIIIRCLVIIGIITVINFTQRNKLETFASQNEEIKKKDVAIQCPEDYLKKLNKFPGCVPKKCGRFVADTVVSLSEVQALLITAQKGFSLGGSMDEASILDLHSGTLSKGESFINIYTVDKNHKVIADEDLKFYSYVKDKIKSFIANHFGLNSNRLYLTRPSFFSRIGPHSSQTIQDEYWHPLVVKEKYQSFHYSSILYLTDYNQHFKGGRLVFIDRNENRTVEPRVGRLTAFTSGSENLHYLEEITSGTRVAIVFSFTCDPKHGMKDPGLPKR